MAPTSQMQPLDKQLVARGDWSFVWSKQSGSRIILIIDDDFIHVGGPRPYPATLSAAQGLSAIFKHASEWDDIRAVGFFYMPPTSELVKEQLIPDVKGWLRQIGSVDDRLYFLVDVFYGPESDLEVGPQVLTGLKTAFQENAKFAYLSQTGEPSLEDPSGPLVKPNVFEKAFVEVESKFRKKLPDSLLRWLGQINDTGRASDWDLSTWKRLRRAAKEMCLSLGNSGGTHDRWAHHLPYGGAYLKDSDSVQLNHWTEQLVLGLQEIVPEVATFPKYGWDIETRDGIPGWDRPPIRALAQATHPGRDLTAAFYLASKDVREISGEPKIHFASSLSVRQYSIERDYLWFNASALMRGLYLLAHSFRHEIVKAQAGKKDDSWGSLPECFLKGNSNRIQCTGGRIFWDISEFEEGEKLGLRIRVTQYLLGWAVAASKDFPGNEESPCLITHKHRYPEKEIATKKVIESYEYLGRSGASFNVDDGTLVLEVRANEVDGVWEAA